VTERQRRRLAAILAADIAGYSSLMGADEGRTVRDLKAHQAVVLPMIAEHGGRIIDTAGDGILAEFGSVVNAVECAVAVQKTMAERNTGIPSDRRMQFRIGVNLGDVIHDDVRVYGDGVNIAARLESIAEPGGICVSAVVHDQVHKKLQLTFTDLGEQHLKNIDEPIRTYRIDSQELGVAQVGDRPALALPEKPSIAVLPLTNLSGDKEQEYFSDGITEDIITELSRFSELFVIARNSSFTYKGKSVDVRQVGRELGVRYILEGSVRRSGERVRITGQLVDATTGVHRWAERYDQQIEDVFAIQDEVARTIVGLLIAHVRHAEIERSLLKPPTIWQAYDFYIRANAAHNSFISTWRLGDLDEARRLLEISLSIDPNYARAYVLRSITQMAVWAHPASKDRLKSDALERAYVWARQAVQLDPNLPTARAQIGWVLARKGQHDAALEEVERASALNVNFIDLRFAMVFVFAGEPVKAIETIKKIIKLDPFYAATLPGWLGFAYYMCKEYAEAVPHLRECVSRAPNYRGGHFWLAATYARLGQLEEARVEAAHALRIDPDYTISGARRRTGLFKHFEDAEHLLEGLRMAGLPE
jgi:adenylate cyclase